MSIVYRMEIVERPNPLAVRYLKSITFDTFKETCINQTENAGKPPHKLSDIKAWYNNLQKFCKDNLKTKCEITRLYAHSQDTPAGMGGRLFCGNSLQGIWSGYRGLLMRDRATDIDMKNCHPVVLKYVCGLHDIPCPNLEYYINHREEILADFNDRTFGKKLFLEAINNNKCKYGKDLPDSFRLFDKEMKYIQQKLMDIDEYKLLKETIPEYKRLYNLTGSLLNRIMCYYENIILGYAIHIVRKYGIEIAILMFDGLMIYGGHYNNTALLTEIEQYVESKMEGLNMKWCYKEHDDEIQIPEDWTPDDDADLVLQKPFPDVVKTFELTHAKITDRAVFVKENPDEVIINSRSQMCVSYEHLKFDEFKNIPKVGKVIVEKQFIDAWLKYENIRCFRDMGVYPKACLCPPDIFNMWRPFEMEKYTDDYVKNDEALLFMRNHIKVLCGNDIDVADYVEKWVAQMFQYPEVKTISPTFISKQGAGKGSFIELLRRMMGRKKIFETTDPARDVWGQFNGCMADAFLVNLDELSQKDIIDNEGKLKGLQTNPAMRINNKGVNQFEIISYHRFLNTTNNLNPMKTTDDDRRNLIVASSNELIGDKDYFNRMYRYLDDINVLRTCYDYFKSIPDMGNFNKIPIPETEYQNNLKEMNVSPVEMWLEDFTRRHINKTQVERLGCEIYEDFETWKFSNNIKYETNTLKLGVLLSNLKINGITKGRHTTMGNTKYFDIPLLKKHFKIGCLVELV